MHRLIRWCLVCSLVLPLFTPEEGRTSSFNVSPLRIVLSGKTSSALLEVTNESPEPVRLQLSVSAWDQKPTGEIVLEATDDIILFPPLLTIEPGEKRKIRLGAVTPRGLAEKTYRVILEELPPARSDGADAGVIRVLTRMTIPVFLEPSRKEVSGDIAALTMRNGTASFELRNTGNTHFSVHHIQLVALDKTGQPIAKHDLEGWYILAGGKRRYEIRLPTESCRKVKTLKVDAQSDVGPLAAQAEMSVEGCGG